MQASNDQRYPGPRARDWLLLVVSVLFVGAGLALLRKAPDVAVPGIAFFGVCAAAAGLTITRKRRFARLRPLTVEIAGGTPIRPARSYIAAVAATLIGLGAVLLVYWQSAPILLLGCSWFLVIVGALLLLGLFTGKVPVGFIQFDPSGLTIGQRRDAFLLSWDNIAGVAPGEFNDNAVLLLWVRDLDSIVVRPAQAHQRVVARLQSNMNWLGAHVMILSAQYRIELPFLVSAIERYIADPIAREALALPRLPPRRAEA